MHVATFDALAARHNINVSGRGNRSMIFAHGFGCDQNMWRFVAPAFEPDYRVVLFDHVGCGKSDIRQYAREKYSSLAAYANDVIAIVQAVGEGPAVFVGHSVSAMIGVLAAIERPDLFDSLVLIGPSPCYLNKDGYTGGFSAEQIDELLDFLDHNHMGWSTAMAPVIMGNPERPELGDELTNSFCQTDPDIARHFARTTFLADNRNDLAKVTTRCLVLQCSNDVIAPDAVGAYVHRQIADSKFVKLQAHWSLPKPQRS